MAPKNKKIEGIVEFILDDMVYNAPMEFIDHFNSLPGRQPSPQEKLVKSILRNMNVEDVKIMIMAVVDQIMFRLFYLIDENLAQKSITDLCKDIEIESQLKSFLELYRERIDPGGVRFE